MEKMKNGSLDFNDILFIFSKLKEISTHPVASMLGFKLTPEKEKVILQQKAIISAMTSKERKNFDLVSKNQSRKERIAKGAGVNIMQVDQLLNVINSLREKSGDIAKMAGNPNQLMEMMKNFKI
jgi:signal recognition particle subunit SRP54